jgi:hypothetical protein
LISDPDKPELKYALNIDDLYKEFRSTVLVETVILKLTEFLKYSIFNRKFSIILR